MGTVDLDADLPPLLTRELHCPDDAPTRSPPTALQLQIFAAPALCLFQNDAVGITQRVAFPGWLPSLSSVHGGSSCLHGYVKPHRTGERGFGCQPWACTSGLPPRLLLWQTLVTGTQGWAPSRPQAWLCRTRGDQHGQEPPEDAPLLTLHPHCQPRRNRRHGRCHPPHRDALSEDRLHLSPRAPDGI